MTGSRCFLGSISTFCLLFASASAPAQEAMSPARVKELAAQIRPDGYTSAKVCGQCHEDIHKAWSE
jgi:hypothetical protein